MEVHIVQKGDTLWKLSRQYGVSFDELKRVNAHLANPDYIVPGMKIFLPATSTGKTETKPTQAGNVKKTEKAPTPVVKKQTKAPEQLIPVPETPAVPGIGEMVEIPLAPKQPVKQPVAPPIPEVPKQQEMPIPTMPTPLQAPPAPPVQQTQWMQQTVQIPPMQMQQMPFFGVPCGWMPIFDADCYPYMYNGYPQQQGTMASPQLRPESPMYISDMPMQLPVIPMPDDWKLCESPTIQFEVPPPRPQAKEKQITKETTEKKIEEKVERVAEQRVERQVERAVEEEFDNLAPIGMQQQYETVGGWAHMGHPSHEFSPYSNCGCGQSHPMPTPIYQQANYCNACNQPIQVMPGHMMPYPMQNYNWHGPY